jgi:hypothetical protein
MQLEYLPEGADQCPLIRLFDFTPGEIQAFQARFAALETLGDQIAVHDLPGVSSPDGCELFLAVGPKERGMLEAESTRQFECILDREGWGGVAELLQPFADGSAGFQWLCTAGAAQWLISRDGTW